MSSRRLFAEIVYTYTNVFSVRKLAVINDSIRLFYCVSNVASTS